MKKTILAVFGLMMTAGSASAACQWDTDQDGWILFDEFMSYYEKEFNRRDANKNGFLTRPEYRTNQFDDIDFNNDDKVERLLQND